MGGFWVLSSCDILSVEVLHVVLLYILLPSVGCCYLVRDHSRSHRDWYQRQFVFFCLLMCFGFYWVRNLLTKIKTTY